MRGVLRAAAGIALASNIGGMTSPISSPQNIFAIERMGKGGKEPSWIQWFTVSLPISCVAVILIWLLLLVTYQPSRYITRVRPPKPPQDPFNRTQWFVVGMSVLTVLLWCAQDALAKVSMLCPPSPFEHNVVKPGMAAWNIQHSPSPSEPLSSLSLEAQMALCERAISLKGGTRSM